MSSWALVSLACAAVMVLAVVAAYVYITLARAGAAQRGEHGLAVAGSATVLAAGLLSLTGVGHGQTHGVNRREVRRSSWT